MTNTQPQNGGKQKNRWTIMVYLAGDNNLAEEMIYALKCMQLVGSQRADYEVFALYDAGFKPTVLPIRERGASRGSPDGVPPAQGLLELAEKIRGKNEGHLDPLHQTLVDTMTKAVKDLETYTRDKAAESGYSPATGASGGRDDVPVQVLGVLDDLKTVSNAAIENGRESVEPVSVMLRDFLVNTINKHPADHYMVVLSGHGSGAVGDFLGSHKRLFGLSIPGLRMLLAEVKERCARNLTGKIDLLGLDSCLMGMAEIAYEVRDHVHFLVGSEGFEANTGWPYDVILNRVRLRDGLISPRELAEAIVREYHNYYSSDYTLAGVSTDQSAIDLTKMSDFASALRRLSKGLEDALSDEGAMDAIILAHWRSQSFKDEQHTDIYDFCSLLQERLGSEIKRLCHDVMNALDKMVVVTSYCGPAFQHAYGLSIFFPWANITDAANVRELDHYGQSLAFSAATGWHRFLAKYHLKTQRKPQGRGDKLHPSTLNRREGLFTGKPEGKAGSPDAEVRAGSPDAEVRAGSPDAEVRAGSPDAEVRAGSPDAEVRAGSRIGLRKIASMKNPPVKWRDGKPMPPHERAAMNKP